MLADEVIAVVAQTQKLSPDEVSLDSSFEELGVDSLDRLEIVTQLEDKYDIRIPDEALRNIRTVRDAVTSLEEHLPADKSGTSKGADA